MSGSMFFDDPALHTSLIFSMFRLQRSTSNKTRTYVVNVVLLVIFFCVATYFIAICPSYSVHAGPTSNRRQATLVSRALHLRVLRELQKVKNGCATLM